MSEKIPIKETEPQDEIIINYNKETFLISWKKLKEIGLKYEKEIKKVLEELKLNVEVESSLRNVQPLPECKNCSFNKGNYKKGYVVQQILCNFESGIIRIKTRGIKNGIVDYIEVKPCIFNDALIVFLVRKGLFEEFKVNLD
ncbi:MAG: hypothetical protein KAI16_02025 [Candidatus Pacebacteria bacterium]|nr:hypothetical protein [Candidatus Paceibacterota bacterium]